MKNVSAKTSTQEALTSIYQLLEKAITSDGLTFKKFGKSIGANPDGLHDSMVGRHIKRAVTPGCDIFLEELLQAGFNITIEHPRHTLRWTNKDLKKHLDSVESYVTVLK